MKTKWLGLLAVGLAGCGGQLDLSPDVALTHRHDAAFRQQVQLLQAGQVTLAAGTNGTPANVLVLELRGVRSAPPLADTLRRRVQKLARLLALDVARPNKYQSISVQVREHVGFWKPDADPQFFIFPLDALRQTPQP